MTVATLPALKPAERKLILQSRKTLGLLNGAFNTGVLTDIQTIGQGTGLIRRRGRPHIIAEADPEAAKGWSAGQRVYATRSRAGWTQQDLADHCGIARANVARLEAGRHAPQVDTLRRVADALKVPLAWILEEPARADAAEDSALAEAGLGDLSRDLERLEKEDPR